MKLARSQKIKSSGDIERLQQKLVSQRKDGEVRVLICATGCRALGAQDVAGEFRERLKKVSLEKKVQVVETGCIGLCALAPVMLIEPYEYLYGGVKIEDIDEIISTTIQKGQAECYCLICDKGDRWILKKFNKGKELNRTYLMAVSSILPRAEGFLAGTQRQILSSEKLTKKPQCYYAEDLANFLDNTILMPQITGMDWAGLADEIRQGRIRLSRSDRLALCMNLTDLICTLEQNNCAHRDLSSGNVYIIIDSHAVYLIDFDSLYHPSLKIPQATTCGTVGYTPPFAWKRGELATKQTWCRHSDRYALSILLTEFLILDRGYPLTADGGMFEQDELRKKYGPGLNHARRVLKKDWLGVLDLFDAAINSTNFNSCPSPKDWQQVLGTMPEARAKPPKLEQLSVFSTGYIHRVPNKQPTTSSQPVPNLSDIKPVHLALPQTTQRYVPLPSAPQQLTPSFPNIKTINLHPPIELPKYIVCPQKTLIPSLNFLNKKPVSYDLKHFSKYLPPSDSWDDNEDEFEEFKIPTSFAIPKYAMDSYKNLKSQGSLLTQKPFYLNLPYDISKYTRRFGPWDDDEDEYGDY